MQMSDKWQELKKPFNPNNIEWRLAQCGQTRDGKFWGMALAYVTARGVQERLDRVFGPENWTVKYRHEAGGVMCELSIRVGDEWITKEDGAQETDIEAFKGGISGAMKRAASIWGIGRYLYRLESGFVQIVPKGTEGAKMGQTKTKERFFWLPPKLPSWALPQNNESEE